MEIGSQRRIAGSGWNIWRAVVGLFYLAAAVFNLTYTLGLAAEPDAFEGYADGAWVPFLGDFIRDVFTPTVSCSSCSSSSSRSWSVCSS